VLGGVFICYRREDSAGFARLIYDRLTSKLGRDAVFFDVDDIPVGLDFVDILSERVGRCEALIAVIGRNWASSVDIHNRYRLDDPNDFVRIEIEAALARKVRVIPVLIDGAAMPQPDHLPDGLKKLARRQGIEISHTRFDSDVDRLTRALSSLDEELRQREAAEVERAARVERERRETEEVGARAEATSAWDRARRMLGRLRRRGLWGLRVIALVLGCVSLLLLAALVSQGLQPQPNESRLTASPSPLTAAQEREPKQNDAFKECSDCPTFAHPADSCPTQAMDKHLAGAAKTSFITRCERTSCEGQAKDNDLQGAAMTSFTAKCLKDALGG
jgi:hypothetical protein